MARKNANWLILILFLFIGLVVGSFIGDLLKGTIGLLSFGKTIGFDPVRLDLAFFQLTLGLKFTINLATVIALFIVLIIYKKI